ncbi:MAG: hypothetical protein ACMUHM_00110 [Thermoplasmatota archaeon]
MLRREQKNSVRSLTKPRKHSKKGKKSWESIRIRMNNEKKEVEWIKPLSNPIILEFEVGEKEIHHVKYSIERFGGQIRVTVDDELIIEDQFLMQFLPRRKMKFQVGDKEKHDVQIDKIKRFFYFGSGWEIFIDGNLIKKYRLI